jgi:hypothetical protein
MLNVNALVALGVVAIGSRAVQYFSASAPLQRSPLHNVHRFSSSLSPQDSLVSAQPIRAATKPYYQTTKNESENTAKI